MLRLSCYRGIAGFLCAALLVAGCAHKNRSYIGESSGETKSNILASPLLTTSYLFFPETRSKQAAGRDTRSAETKKHRDALYNHLDGLLSQLIQRHNQRREILQRYLELPLRPLKAHRLTLLDSQQPVIHIEANGELVIDLKIIRSVFLSTLGSGAIERRSYSANSASELQQVEDESSLRDELEHFLQFRQSVEEATSFPRFLDSVVWIMQMLIEPELGSTSSDKIEDYASVSAQLDERYLGALLFLLAHELGHWALGHFELSNADLEEADFQSFELESDQYAVALLTDAYDEEFLFGGQERVSTAMSGYRLYFQLAERLAGFREGPTRQGWVYPSVDSRLQISSAMFDRVFNSRKAELGYAVESNWFQGQYWVRHEDREAKAETPASDIQLPASMPYSAGQESSSKLVVMIKSTQGFRKTHAAGLLFAISDKRALILTPDENVRILPGTPLASARDVEVSFQTEPGRFYPARVLKAVTASFDLAVLEVELPQGFAVQPYHTALLRLDSNPVKQWQHIPVIALGYPENILWGRPEVNDSIVRDSANRYFLERVAHEPGYNGAGLLTADAQLLGIIRLVAPVASLGEVQARNFQRRVAAFIPTDVITYEIHRWGLPVGYVENDDRLQAAVANLFLIEVDENGRMRYELESDWNNLSDKFPYRWVVLEFSKTSGFTAALKKEYGTSLALEIKAPGRGVQRLFSIVGASPVQSLPIYTADLSSVSLQVIEDDVFVDDRLTRTIKLAQHQSAWLRGQSVTLPLDSHVRSQMGYASGQGNISMQVRARYFDPEANSGADQHFNTAAYVKPYELKSGQVSFDRADATDMVFMNTSGADCEGLMWVTNHQPYQLYVTIRPDQRSSLTNLTVLPEDAADSEQEPKYIPVELWEIHCDGHEITLKFQAQDILQGASYHLFTVEEKRADELQAPVMRAWLQYFWGSRKEGSNHELVMRGMDRIAELTGADHASLITEFEKLLAERDTKHFPDYLVSRDFAQYRDVHNRCCGQAERFGILLELLAAEAGLEYDEKILQRMSTLRNFPSNLKVRIRKMLEAGAVDRGASPDT